MCVVTGVEWLLLMCVIGLSRWGGGGGVWWVFFFFFKQKTAYEIGTGDWSSDVCSSDLKAGALPQREMGSIKSGALPQQEMDSVK